MPTTSASISRSFLLRSSDVQRQRSAFADEEVYGLRLSPSPPFPSSGEQMIPQVVAFLLPFLLFLLSLVLGG